MKQYHKTLMAEGNKTCKTTGTSDGLKKRIYGKKSAVLGMSSLKAALKGTCRGMPHKL